jgi:hypothetical protein
VGVTRNLLAVSRRVFNVIVTRFSGFGGDDTVLASVVNNQPLRLDVELNGDVQTSLPLSQNGTTELFDSSVTSVVSPMADCHKGATFRIDAEDSGDHSVSFDDRGTLS